MRDMQRRQEDEAEKQRQHEQTMASTCKVS